MINSILNKFSAVRMTWLHAQSNRFAGVILLSSVFFSGCLPGRTPTAVNAIPTEAPELVSAAYPSTPVLTSITSAGDYLVRNQLSNGHLAYEVNIQTHRRLEFPSFVRLIAANGSLFTVCRVSAQVKYCQAGDRALDYYLPRLVEDPQRFDGACFSEENDCSLGGSALAIDAIYKRWRAVGNFDLDGRDLKQEAVRLGKFLVWMRRPEGGFYHSFDPYPGGRVDPDFFVIYFPGESLMALLELYEMTGDESWLAQAREVNAYMLTQPVNEDHWHAYALGLFARLDKLTPDDITYGIRIGQAIIAGEEKTLAPTHSSISTATRLEATASLGQAMFLSGQPYAWLDTEMEKFAGFVMARQLPDNNCGWITSAEMSVNYAGGIYKNCTEPSIRIDALQHWINGAAAYLDYEQMLQ